MQPVATMSAASISSSSKGGGGDASTSNSWSSDDSYTCAGACMQSSPNQQPSETGDCYIRTGEETENKAQCLLGCRPSAVQSLQVAPCLSGRTQREAGALGVGRGEARQHQVQELLAAGAGGLEQHALLRAHNHPVCTRHACEVQLLLFLQGLAGIPIRLQPQLAAQKLNPLMH